MPKRNPLCLLLSSVAIVATANFALADDFYKDRTVTVVVPSGSGGTYHVYCQLVARNLGRHLPGNPEVIVQNRPGAGGAKAARYMVTAAPKDGTVIAMINPGSIMTPLLRPGVGFDTRKMHWLGSMSQRTYTIGTFHTSKTRSLADAKARETVMGATGKAATTYLMPKFINDTVGTKFKIISGYKGGGALNLAMERGEIEGRANFYSGYTGVRPEWLRDNKINFLFTLGPSRPEVEKIAKLRDAMKSRLDHEMLDLLEVSFFVGQAFYAPPGTPEPRVATLRTAFTAMMADPKTKANAEKRRVPMRTLGHQEVAKEINKGFGASDKAVTELRKILGFHKKKS